MTENPSSPLAERFARRVAERDSPPPPAPLSQEPAAVLARLGAWLHAQHSVRDARGQQRLAHMLVALMEQPACHTGELAQVAGLGPRQAARAASRLAALGLTDWAYRGLWRYHWLTRPAEDALLLVVAPAAAPGPAALPAPRPFRRA